MKQIHERFSELQQYGFLSILKPENAGNLYPRSLSTIYKRLPWLEKVTKLSDAEREYRSHVTLNLDLNGNLSEYWNSLICAKNSAGNLCFPNLMLVIVGLFSLSFSNAPVERVFSQLCLMKTKKRNAIKKETLRGLMHTKITCQDRKRSDPDIQSKGFAGTEPTPVMYKQMKSMTTNADDEETRALRLEFLEKISS